MAVRSKNTFSLHLLPLFLNIFFASSRDGESIRRSHKRVRKDRVSGLTQSALAKQTDGQKACATISVIGI